MSKLGLLEGFPWNFSLIISCMLGKRRKTHVCVDELKFLTSVYIRYTNQKAFSLVCPCSPMSM